MAELSSSTEHSASRPPVVVVLGHVDHGKTKLLDAIRNTNVIEGESGGITQHIGAYQAETNGRLITFLDTPGHEAFTAIRSRGAKVADVAVLVVAADESVKPQTREAIRIIKDAGIPCIVAINKTDKEGANPAKVKQDLAQEDVLVEEWGGQTPALEISAKTGAGIPELLDMVNLVAELQELTSTTTGPASGVIIESNLDKRRGYVATALVQNGTLRVGDWIVVDHVVGKVKSMEDFRGAALETASPSQPVLLTGWPEAPRVGGQFRTATAKKAAEDLAADSITPPPVAFDTYRGQEAPGSDRSLLNVIFKADVASSLEAIELAVASIPNEHVGLRVLASGIGNITEADVKTAAAKGAIILGFRVATEPAAQKLAERDGIRIASFDIIYELVEAVRTNLATLLPTETKRTVLGKLRVLAIFKTESRAVILGGKVTSGSVKKGSLVDLARGETPTRIGKVTNLQQEKEDVSEVAQGVECGLRIDTSSFDGDIQEGDVLEFVTEETVQQTL
ncbi:MAG: translation initiation factor IF-2 [Candidatus Yanofskybacteria bacterium]|nr:translation initiation factor IF-2 [Candidatus Yanofskybacteria bacterium]